MKQAGIMKAEYQMQQTNMHTNYQCWFAENTFRSSVKIIHQNTTIKDACLP